MSCLRKFIGSPFSKVKREIKFNGSYRHKQYLVDVRLRIINFGPVATEIFSYSLDRIRRFL